MGVLYPLPSEQSVGHNDVAVGRLIVFEILSVILQLVSIVFNGAIICTLCRRSLLKYPSNRFVFSLCISHLVVSILSITISLVSTFVPSSESLSTFKGSHYESYYSGNEAISRSPGENFPTNQVVCSTNGVDLAHLIMMHLNFGVAVCTSITVALISTERYITIARPMRYKSIVTARRSLYAIICCWLLAAIITMMPLLFFENRHPICGTFSVPMESLATYFGIVFAVVTVFALGVMIVCYTHIFRIAKAKCQKVQIGHFTASTVSSISSDWPSSAYSSIQGQNRVLNAGSRIESSNSLLHWVLMTNLGRHAQPLRVPNALRGGIPLTPPATPTLPPKNAFFSETALNSRRESDGTAATRTSGGGDIRNGSTILHTNGAGGKDGNGDTNSSTYFIDPSRSPQTQHRLAHRKLRNRWKTYLQPNYNSPRKTIFTIVLLIGAVLFTQLPLSFVLFTSTVDATQKWFQFCTTVLFSTSSVANPVLYGFLNRSIRDQLWRILKRKSRGEHCPSASSLRKRKRGQQQQQLDEMVQNAKGFLSPANQCHLQSLCLGNRAGVARGKALEIPAIKIFRKDSISSDDNSSVHSVASTSSINSIGINDASRVRANSTGGVSKVKINQVQKRATSSISSSPYYRTVLLKKAHSISKSNSLLPRLALPNVNIRRNSSGSIDSISSNGVMSNTKGKVKETDSEWAASSSEIDKYDGGSCRENGDHRRNIGKEKQNDLHIEMQTFRNYSTPDLQLSTSLPSIHDGKPEPEPNETSKDENVCHDNKEDVNVNDLLVVENNIEISPEMQTKGQFEVENAKEESPDEKQDVCDTNQPAVSKSNENVAEFNNSDVSLLPIVASSSSQNNSQPSTSNSIYENQITATLEMQNDGDMLPDNFPRKPSQDSGADMAFSDEEDEASPQMSSGSHQLSPIILSAAALSALPGGTVSTIMLNSNNCTTSPGQEPLSASSSYSSLFGTLFFVGYPDDGGTGNVTPSTTEVLLLPCSCAESPATCIVDDRDVDIVASRNDNCPSEHCGQEGIDNNINHVENSVTVTITDSNSDTQLFNPQLFNSNSSVLCVDSNLLCSVQARDSKPHKSKSESDICRGCSKNSQDLDLKVRSNCHINHIALNNDRKVSLYCTNAYYHCHPQTSSNQSFTAVSSCKNCCKMLESNDSSNLRGSSGSCCLVWLNDSQKNDSHPSLENLKSSDSNAASFLNLATPQWLSVMSVHASTSSLSSTCPLNVISGHNSKSDISDYDDFEDHIET